MDNPRICSPQEREIILKRDGHKCRYCGKSDSTLHIDHVYPWSRGGITVIENLVSACPLCNSKKHNSIGVWPKPIGYFDKKPKEIQYLSIGILVLSFVMLYNSLDIALNYSDFIHIGRIFGFFGVIFGLIGISRIIIGK